MWVVLKPGMPETRKTRMQEIRIRKPGILKPGMTFFMYGFLTKINTWKYVIQSSGSQLRPD